MTLRTPLTATLLLVSVGGVACSGATTPDAGSGLTVSFSAQAPVSSSELSFVSVSSRAEFETSFSPTLAVDDAPVNLTVHADVTTWFKTQSGTVIDPATATPGGPNAGLVTDNIRRSFKAFRDDDRNGHDDGDDHAHA